MSNPWNFYTRILGPNPEGEPLTLEQLDSSLLYLSSSLGTTGSITASYALTASYIVTAQTASYITASNVNGTVASATSASYALTASYALNGGGGTIDSSSFATTSSNTFTGNQIISGSILISGSIIPNTDGVSSTSSFDLGSPTNAWKDIYVSNGTINFLDGTGSIQATLSSTGTGLTLPLTLDLATASKIESIPASSGDGNGYTTLELTPDTDLGTDQYIVLDPTTPNHIHVRAGGTIDSSSAVLFLGGEITNVSIDDQNLEAKLKTTNDVFVTQSNFTTASGFSSAVWDTNSGSYTITINDPTVDIYNATYALTSVSILTAVTESNYTDVTILSTTASGYPATITFAIQQAPPTASTNLDELIFEIRQLADSYVEVSGTDVTIQAQDDVRIYAKDVLSLRNNSSTDAIDIRTDYNGNDYGWEFNADGNTVFPYLTTPRGDVNSGNLTTNTLKLGDGTNEAVISTPDGTAGYSNSQRLVINPGQGSGSGEGGDIYLWAGRGGVDSGTGGDVKVRGGYGLASGSGGYVRIEGGDTDHGTAGFVEIKGGNSTTENGGDVYIYGGQGNANTQNGDVTITTYDTSGQSKNWNFATDGITTIPDVLQLTVRTTDPASPVEGMIMASGSAGSSQLFYYNGTAWVDLTA
jgi:hypothetical protein